VCCSMPLFSQRLGEQQHGRCTTQTECSVNNAVGHVGKFTCLLEGVYTHVCVPAAQQRHFFWAGCSCMACETVPGTGEAARFPAETLGTHKDGNTGYNVTSSCMACRAPWTVKSQVP
jgi:hypothetical protein